MKVSILGRFIQRSIRLSRQINPRNYSASELQMATLRDLLRNAQDTDFGRHYRFSEILKSSRPMVAFRESIPMFDYDSMYSQWWHRSEAQESDVAWPGRVKYFALSSGTAGAPSKHIPVTDDMLRSMRRASTEMFLTMGMQDIDPTFYQKTMLMLGSSTKLTDKGSYQIGDLSGINAANVPRWFKRYYKPSSRILEMTDYNDRINEIAKAAKKWDIGVISGIPSWVQIMMERVIAYHGVSNIHEVWPNFQIYASGGVAFEPYRQSFERLTGKPITVVDTYLASEGFIALQDRIGANAMRLCTGNGIYFEFVPFNDDNFSAEGELLSTAQALTLDDVKVGVDYALLISTCAGAWRYLIGDTIRFVDMDRCEIVISGRTKHYLSVTGEHMTVDNMNQALTHVGKLMGCSIKEFTVKALPLGDVFMHQWYVGIDLPVDETKFRDLLDEYLCAHNDDYRVSRQRKGLAEVRLTCLRSKVFYDWQASKGKLGGQSKFPRVMKTELWNEWTEYLKSKGAI